VPGHLSAGVQHLLHGVPGTSAEVDNVVLARLHRLQRCEVRLAQVDDVQVVPDRGAIGSRVVSAVDVDTRASPCRDGKQVGNEMGFRFVPLSMAPEGAADVEVAQACGCQTVCPARSGKHVVHGKLALSVGVDRNRGDVFGDRVDVRLAVGGRA
jgi:hypothetical protein